MKLLLDTHVWLWSHLDPERLARRVRRALTDAKTELWLSPISVWELALLVDRGRVRLTGASFSEWLRRAFAEAPLQDAPFTREVALEMRNIQLAHDDPADRMLAATARVFDLQLVTADARLLRGSGFRTFANAR